LVLHFDIANPACYPGSGLAFTDLSSSANHGTLTGPTSIADGAINFDGTANPAFVARRCAAPLLFDCFHHLRLPNRPDPAPPGVKQVELCAVSGQLPSPHCRHRRMGWFLPGVSPIKPCEIHRELLLDPRTGRRVAADDGTRPLLREVYEIWPPDVLALFREAGLPRREIPPLEPGQPVAASPNARPPQITSPQRSLVYALQLQDPGRRSIPLRVDAAAGVRTVFWFAGSSFLGSGAPGSPFLWKPSPGNWEVYVLDDQGRSDSCKVRVEVVE
jgi:penicillin-binding protein 1C